MAVLRAAVAAAILSTLMGFAVADTFYSTLDSFTGKQVNPAYPARPKCKGKVLLSRTTVWKLKKHRMTCYLGRRCHSMTVQ